MNKTNVVLIAALSAWAGCSSKGDSEHPAPAASQGGEATPPEATANPNGVSAQRLRDGQIVQLLASVDTAEINQGRLALTRATDPRVREYAQHMIDQHSQSKQKGSQLASANNLTPEPSPLAAELESKTTQVLTSFESAKPAAFDSTYMNAQITQHKEVLDIIDSQLIPAAKSPDLSARLSSMRNLVQMHLSEAQRIAPSLTAAAD